MMQPSWKLTANLMAGLLIIGLGYSWWDYARTEQAYRQRFLAGSQLLLQLNQIKGQISSHPSSEACGQLNSARIRYLDLIRQDDRPTHPITTVLVGGKTTVIQNIMDRIRADIETLNAKCVNIS